MPTYSDRVKKLLDRSARFKRKIQKALMKHDKNADLIALNELLEKVNHELIRLGRKTPPKKGFVKRI